MFPKKRVIPQIVCFPIEHLAMKWWYVCSRIRGHAIEDTEDQTGHFTPIPSCSHPPFGKKPHVSENPPEPLTLDICHWQKNQVRSTKNRTKTTQGLQTAKVDNVEVPPHMNVIKSWWKEGIKHVMEQFLLTENCNDQPSCYKQSPCLRCSRSKSDRWHQSIHWHWKPDRAMEAWRDYREREGER